MSFHENNFAAESRLDFWTSSLEMNPTDWIFLLGHRFCILKVSKYVSHVQCIKRRLFSAQMHMDFRKFRIHKIRIWKLHDYALWKTVSLFLNFKKLVLVFPDYGLLYNNSYWDGVGEQCSHYDDFNRPIVVFIVIFLLLSNMIGAAILTLNILIVVGRLQGKVARQVLLGLSVAQVRC